MNCNDLTVSAFVLNLEEDLRVWLCFVWRRFVEGKFFTYVVYVGREQERRLGFTFGSASSSKGEILHRFGYAQASSIRNLYWRAVIKEYSLAVEKT